MGMMLELYYEDGEHAVTYKAYPGKVFFVVEVKDEEGSDITLEEFQLTVEQMERALKFVQGLLDET